MVQLITNISLSVKLWNGKTILWTAQNSLGKILFIIVQRRNYICCLFKWEKKILCSKLIVLKTFNFRFNGLPIYVNCQYRRNTYSKKKPWRKDRLVLFDSHSQIRWEVSSLNSQHHHSQNDKNCFIDDKSEEYCFFVPFGS